MINTITGKLTLKKPPVLTIEVNGLGYLVHCPMETFYHIPELNQTVKLYTHLAVREDAHTLYGFHDEPTQALFKSLIKINGVGPKIALAILSGISPQQFAQAINEQNHKQLTKIPGVGPKMAERLVLELKGKLADWSEGSCSELALSGKQAAGPAQEAFDALVSLGYKESEAKKMLKHVEDLTTAEDMIRSALRAGF